MAFRDSLLRSWQKPNVLTVFLWPLSQVYRLIYALRKLLYKLKLIPSYKASVPVLIVGNLTVGGTGKTPFVIYLVEFLRARGFKPGVISRGYNGVSSHYPLEVLADTAVSESGDEPALIVRRTGVPMVVGPNRGKSIDVLLAQHSIDIVISDDGLQHLALQRDLELCLLDDTSVQNNPFMLPAGPYREALSRLDSVDFVVRHSSSVSEASVSSGGQFQMQLCASEPRPLLEDPGQNVFDRSEKVHALAGIGNPQRFFDTCDALGIGFEAHSFPDHHQYVATDIEFSDDRPVLMTEKDAVKCTKFANQKHWYLPVDAKLSDGFNDALLTRLKKFF